jgi:hypothetical protein
VNNRFSSRARWAAAMGVVLVIASSAVAQSPPESRRTNLRLTVDLSADAVSGADGTTVLGTVGVDSHKVFGDRRGDWATVVMQGYWTRADHQSDGRPGDTSFMYRIFNINLTRYGRGKFNVRVGHFEVPFGLEQVVNTNGTLRDYMHGHNIGIKADWGVGLNGAWRRGEYEVAWSRGTESSLTAKHGSYLVSGRVGTPSDGNLVFGASALRGKVVDATSPLGVSDRLRLGADVAWYRGAYGLLAESAYGTDGDPERGVRRSVSNSLVEVNRTDIADHLTTYLQARLFSRETAPGWRRQHSAALGLRYALDGHWSTSAEYARAAPAEGLRGHTLRVQLRHRF